MGIERGLESMVANLTFDWDVHGRSKLTLISGDLLALGSTVEEILSLPTCTAMQEVRDPVEAHCWLFVVERVSTAHWAAYHQLDNAVREIAASYLGSVLAGRSWNQVCEAFDRFSVDARVLEQLVTSTEHAMREHYEWIAAPDSIAASAHAAPRMQMQTSNNSKALDEKAHHPRGR